CPGPVQHGVVLPDRPDVARRAKAAKAGSAGHAGVAAAAGRTWAAARGDGVGRTIRRRVNRRVRGCYVKIPEIVAPSHNHHGNNVDRAHSGPSARRLIKSSAEWRRSCGYSTKMM